MSNYKQIGVGKLLLNVSNYRIVKQTSQKAARDAIIEEQGKKLVTLANDILKNGLNPSDLPVVIDAEDGDDNYIVIEGNRRITTINLLLDPELAKGHGIHKAFLKLSKASDAIPKVIYCSIAPTKKEALLWADRKHANGLGGSGTEPWTAMAKARADADRGDPAPALDVVNFVLTNNNLEPAVRHQLEGSKFNITTLERLVTTKELQEGLGLRLDDGKVKAESNIEWVKAVLSDVVTIIATGKRNGAKWTERDIDDQAKRSAFAKEVASSHKGKKSSKAWVVSGAPRSTAATNGSKARKGRSTPTTAEQVNLIPKAFKLTLPAGKINDIFTELKRLDVTTYRHAVSVLFRVFLDLSVDEYIKKHGVQLPTDAKTGRKDDRLKTRLQKVVEHAKKAGLLDHKELHPVEVSMSNKNSLLATETLNAYVHSKWMNPEPGELKTAWLNIQLFLERLWMGR